MAISDLLKYLLNSALIKSFDINIVSAKLPKYGYVDEITILQLYGYESNITDFEGRSILHISLQYRYF
jgi:hypothetical protein